MEEFPEVKVDMPLYESTQKQKSCIQKLYKTLNKLVLEVKVMN